MDQVRRPYCARWRAGDDDHQVAALVAAEREQRLVDLADHAVGGRHHRDDERLGAHVMASWLRTSGQAVKASSGSGVCRRANRFTVSPDWVKATRALASSRSPMSRAA